MLVHVFLFFFCKQKTAYEMRISDWSSDVCSSDLPPAGEGRAFRAQLGDQRETAVVLMLAGKLGAAFGDKPAGAVLPADDEIGRRGIEKDIAQQIDRKSVV